eukprot:6686164-Alexandrium_andersonii.AAC.1
MASAGRTASPQAGPRAMSAQCRARAAEVLATGSQCGDTKIPISPLSSLQTALRPRATCLIPRPSSRPRARKSS